MIKRVSSTITREFQDYKVLLRSVPSTVMVLFCVSVVFMNLLANKEIALNLSWLALDCGFILSWISFLCMDMLTKRFGPKAAIKLSLFTVGISLLVSLILYIISMIPGNWGEYYTYNNSDVNGALNSTFGGTWYVLLGSALAFIGSSIVNALLNAFIGKTLDKNRFREYALRSYISTVAAQFVDNMIFALVVSHVFFGWTLLQCITCSITGCIVELVSEVIFSPFGYRVCKQWEHDGVGLEYLEYNSKRGDTV